MKAIEQDRPAKILIVDDEPQITRVLRTALSTQGYSLRVAGNGVQALEAAHEWKPDLVITDLAMPEMNGVELCHELRAVSQVPIIVLSVRSQDRMKIEALDAGADDYVTKPFRTQELLARIRAALRRAPSARASEIQHLTLGTMEVDFEARRVRAGQRDVRFTPKELDVLRYLALHAGKVVPHRELLQAVWGPDYGDEVDYLRVIVNQLRKKIEAEPSRPVFLLTEPWVGYRLQLSASTPDPA